MDDTRESPVAGVKRGRRGRRRLILVVVVLVLVGWFGRFAYLRITMRPTPRPEYWEAQLAALDPPGPGAISAAEARRILRNYPRLVVPPPATQGRVGPGGYPLPPTPGIGFIPMPPVSPGYDDIRLGPWDESRPEIQAAGRLFSTAAFKDNREVLRKAVEAGWWDDLFIDLAADMDLDLLHEYTRWGECLVAHSRWVREHEHDTKAMAEDWLMALRLARQMRRWNRGLPYLAATAAEVMVGGEMGLAAREGAILEDVCALAREVDAIVEPFSYPSRLAAAERIYERNCIDFHFIREGGDWIDVSELAVGHGYGHGRASSYSTPISRYWNVASPLFHDYAAACQNVDSFCVAVASLVDMRACHAIWTPDDGGRFTNTVGLLDGQPEDSQRPVAQYVMRGYERLMKVEASLTMLALAQFKREREHYPDLLVELKPDFLPRLPVDYADRGVLRYRREGDYYVLYSIGPDGEDNGGIASGRYSESFWLNKDMVYSTTTRRKERR